MSVPRGAKISNSDPVDPLRRSTPQDSSRDGRDADHERAGSSRRVEHRSTDRRRQTSPASSQPAQRAERSTRCAQSARSRAPGRQVRDDRAGLFSLLANLGTACADGRPLRALERWRMLSSRSERPRRLVLKHERERQGADPAALLSRAGRRRPITADGMSVRRPDEGSKLSAEAATNPTA